MTAGAERVNARTRLIRGPHWTLIPVVLLAGCGLARNFDDPAGPRFVGGVTPPRAASAVVRVVTLNLNFAQAPDSLIAFLRDASDVRDADVLLLQEADSATSRSLAAALGRAYVYVPAAWHPVSERDFGNAILTAWPVLETRKVLLPHLGIWRLSRRAATAATLCVGGTRMRVYSVHLGMATEISNRARRAQLATILRDAARFPVALVGGDFNSEGTPELAVERGFDWPTRDLGPTMLVWGLDHVLIRGAGAVDAGITPVPDGVSDHRAVWVTVRLGTSGDRPPCAPVTDEARP